MKKFKKITLGILVLLEAIFIILFVTISALICQSVSWMFDTWQHLTMSELMYQLNAPATGTNSDIIYDYIMYPGCCSLSARMPGHIHRDQKKRAASSANVHQSVSDGSGCSGRDFKHGLHQARCESLHKQSEYLLHIH